MIQQIEYTDRMKKFARQLEAEVHQSLERRGKSNYTGVTAKDRYYKGFLGEMAMFHALKERGIACVYSANTVGFSDSGDILTWTHARQAVKLDVKTTFLDTGELFIFAKQHNKSDVFIGVKLHDFYATVEGWTNPAYGEHGFIGHQNPYAIIKFPHQYLVDMEPLYERLLVGDAIFHHIYWDGKERKETY